LHFGGKDIYFFEIKNNTGACNKPWQVLLLIFPKTGDRIMRTLYSNLLTITFVLASTICNAQFTEVFAVPNQDMVYALSANDSNIFIGSGGRGMFRSPDNGDTWVDINNGIPNWYYFSLLASNDSLFAGSFGTVNLSANNGNIWSDLHIGLGTNDYINSIVRKGQSLYIGVHLKGVYRNQLGTTNWDVVNNGFHTNPSIWDMMVIGNDIYAATDQGIYRSSDDAASWNFISNGMPLNTTVFKLFFHNTVLFAGAATGLYKTTDWGNTWIESANGLPQSSSITCFSELNDSIFIGTYTGVYVSTNLGNSWSAFNSGLPGAISIYASTIHKNYLYVGGTSVYRHVSSVTGINQVTDDNRVTMEIYPDPVTDFVTVELSQGKGKYILSIVDLYGREIRSLNSDEHKLKIDLSDLKKGIYFIKYKNDQIIAKKRVIRI